MPPRDGKCCHHLATVRVWWHAASLCSRCHSSKCTQKRCTICNWSPKKIHIKCEYSIEKQESAPKANCLTSIYKKNLKWMSHFSQKHSNVGPRVKKAEGTHSHVLKWSNYIDAFARLRLSMDAKEANSTRPLARGGSRRIAFKHGTSAVIRHAAVRWVSGLMGHPDW